MPPPIARPYYIQINIAMGSSLENLSIHPIPRFLILPSRQVEDAPMQEQVSILIKCADLVYIIRAIHSGGVLSATTILPWSARIEC